MTLGVWIERIRTLVWDRKNSGPHPYFYAPDSTGNPVKSYRAEGGPSGALFNTVDCLRSLSQTTTNEGTSMIAFLRFAVLVLAVSVIVGCSDTSDSSGNSGGADSATASSVVADSSPCDTCLYCDTCFLSDHNSISIFPQTQELWTKAFVTRFDRLEPTYRYVSIPANTLELFLNTPLDPKNPTGLLVGLKAYLALEGPAATDDETFDKLCLILVPYVQGAGGVMIDSSFAFPEGNYVKLRPEATPGNISYMQHDSAQQLIDFWALHYNAVESENMVRISSFVITRETLERQIDTARTPTNDSIVYFMYGFHTLDPMDSSYCVKYAPGYQRMPGYSGFEVYNLILSSVDIHGRVEHSSDFLRPCPRYCGKPKFTSNF